MAKLVDRNHPALHTMAEEITAEDFSSGTVAKIVKDLHAALADYSVEGFTPVAIAAPQIGCSKRMFLIASPEDDTELPNLVAINPVITQTSKKTQLVGEGCLSLPDLYGEVYRYKNVTFRAQDETGASYERNTGTLLAQIVQHEIDHLDGILFTDRAERVWSIDEQEAHSNAQ